MDYFRRRLRDDYSMRKIGVLGNDCAVIYLSIFPDLSITPLLVNIDYKGEFFALPNRNPAVDWRQLEIASCRYGLDLIIILHQIRCEFKARVDIFFFQRRVLFEYLVNLVAIAQKI